MGYELHITREAFHAINTGHQISEREWLSYIAQDNELVLSTNNGPYLPIGLGNPRKKTSGWIGLRGMFFPKTQIKSYLPKCFKSPVNWVPKFKVMMEKSMILQMIYPEALTAFTDC